MPYDPNPRECALASASASAPAPSALDLLHAFRRCAHLQGATKGCRPHGQGRVLAYLLREGPLTQRDLAERLERTPATLSQQLDAMEAAGLVVRCACEADRRTLVVSLTPEGGQAAHAAIDERRRVAEELFGDLDEADRRDLLRLLEGRLARWQGMAGEPGAPRDGRCDARQSARQDGCR